MGMTTHTHPERTKLKYNGLLSDVAHIDVLPVALNNEAIKAVNAAGTGTVDLIKANASDQVELGATAVIGAVASMGAVTMASAAVVALSAAGFTMANVARTATAAGDGTGAIAAGPKLQFVAVTCDDANKIITLPAPSTGDIVLLMNGATGYEIRTSAPGTIAINGGSGSGAESAIAASTLVMLVCTSATTWVGSQWGTNGALTAVQVAAA